MSLLRRLLKCVRLVDLRHHVAFGGFLKTIFWRFLVGYQCLQFEWCWQPSLRPFYHPTMSVRLLVVEIQRRWPVGSVFISPIYSHLADRVTIRTSFGLFILGYFSMFTLLLIWEHLFVKGVCCLSIATVDFTGKRTFHSTKRSVNRSHFVNYSMMFFFTYVGVVYKSN